VLREPEPARARAQPIADVPEESAMAVVEDTLEDLISADLAGARSELAQARLALGVRDDAVNRQAVVLGRAHADALLDMYLAVTRDTRGTVIGRPAAAADAGR
jgi:hypothetical protein